MTLPDPDNADIYTQLFFDLEPPEKDRIEAMNIEEFFPKYRVNRPKKQRRETPKKDLEAGVLRECLEWLHAHPAVLYVERRNTGAVAFSDGGFMRFGAVGAADIFCLVALDRYWPRTHVEIECKRRNGKGKLSEKQKVFRAKMLDIGVPYFVVTSAADLEKQFKESGLTD